MNHMKLSEDLNNLANKFKSLYDLSEAFQKLGSLEQAERELLARVDKAKQLADASVSEKAVQEKALETAKVAVAVEYKKAEEAKKKSEDHSASIVSDAYKLADQIEKQAESKADLFLAKAASAKSELSQLSGEVLEKKVELEKVKAELEAIKAKFAAFMKG